MGVPTMGNNGYIHSSPIYYCGKWNDVGYFWFSRLTVEEVLLSASRPLNLT